MRLGLTAIDWSVTGIAYHHVGRHYVLQNFIRVLAKPRSKSVFYGSLIQSLTVFRSN
jgi:hypothetical protein